MPEVVREQSDCKFQTNTPPFWIDIYASENRTQITASINSMNPREYCTCTLPVVHLSLLDFAEENQFCPGEITIAANPQPC